jgi:hypothetical protein
LAIWGQLVHWISEVFLAIFATVNVIAVRGGPFSPSRCLLARPKRAGAAPDWAPRSWTGLTRYID